MLEFFPEPTQQLLFVYALSQANANRRLGKHEARISVALSTHGQLIGQCLITPLAHRATSIANGYFCETLQLTGSSWSPTSEYSWTDSLAAANGNAVRSLAVMETLGG